MTTDRHSHRLFHGDHGFPRTTLQYPREQIGQRHGGPHDDGVSQLPIVCLRCLHLTHAIFDVV